MITFPNAKINLGLSITEKRSDGYHNLETIFYPLPIEDALEVLVKPHSPNKYTLFQTGLPLEGDIENNLVVKAYKLLDEDFNLPCIEIHLHKHIPSGAGLGGGSSDAAFMLRMLNDIFELNLSTLQLESYAAKLGADCAFFIQNRPTYAEGIGNIFSPVKLSLKGYQYLLIKPDVFVSTRDAFSNIIPQRPQYSVKEVIQKPITEWHNILVNDFEASVFPQFPIIREIKEKLYRHAALYASMSGSGSSVFALFSPEEQIPRMDFEYPVFMHQGKFTI